ncbi:MAG TPA: hypothetical protein VIF15_16900 [Polyangiaceae bacterium]|jgi:hypothetical protein
MTTTIAKTKTAPLPRRTIASLKLPTKVPALITVARAIVQSMTGNSAFPTTNPPLATVTAAIDDLEAAETATQSKTRGAAATRNVKRAALVTLLHQLKAGVQQAADASPDQASTLIQSAGLSVKKTGAHPPRVFAAKSGAVSGQVTLVAQSAARRASYEWETSIDGGKTWQLASASLQAKTTVSGLVPGASVMFRYRPVTKIGEADWSQPVALIVK